MTTPLHVLVSTLALIGTTALQPLPAQPSTPTDRQLLVAALNRFAADLHDQLATADDGSIYSPASISFSMLMLLPGARAGQQHQH